MLDSLFIKKDSNTGYCEYCEIFKSSYFEEHLQTFSDDNFPRGYKEVTITVQGELAIEIEICVIDFGCSYFENEATPMITSFYCLFSENKETYYCEFMICSNNISIISCSLVFVDTNVEYYVAYVARSCPCFKRLFHVDHVYFT